MQTIVVGQLTACMIFNDKNGFLAGQLPEFCWDNGNGNMFLFFGPDAATVDGMVHNYFPGGTSFLGPSAMGTPYPWLITTNPNPGSPTVYRQQNPLPPKKVYVIVFVYCKIGLQSVSVPYLFIYSPTCTQESGGVGPAPDVLLPPL